MKVGFIGLGRMGAAMAGNLLKAGHEVTVYNRSPDKARALSALGARVAASVADTCRGEAVITMLANDEAVETVVFDRAGVLASTARDGLHISMSTISVALSTRLHAAHAAAGQRFVAAPVFGRPDAAAAAQLFIVAAGARAAVDACGTAVFGHGSEGFQPGRGAQRRQSGEAQRQFPDRLGDRSAWRGHGIDRQGADRPAHLSGSADFNAVHRAHCTRSMAG